jgi:N6-L-threonylcarbamoyladenine synthase/protein kinase Bud32
VVQGAEARVTFAGTEVRKEREPRSYRHPALDERLRERRTRREARLTSAARREGVPTPVVRDVDPAEGRLVLQHVGDRDLRAAPTVPRVRALARHLATLHEAGFVHGDPTPRNVRVRGEGTDPGDGVGGGEADGGGDPGLFLIDFGLGYHTGHPEDHAMDLHVLLGSIAGTTDDADRLREAALDAYREAGDGAVLERLADIEGRGRYR